MVLCFVNPQQRLPAERLDTDEHLETAGAPEEFNEVPLTGNLRVALHKEWQIAPFFDHPFQKIYSFGILVEIIRREHHKPHACGFGCPECLDGRLDVLTADPMAGNLDNGAEITRKRTTPSGINPDHRNEISL